MPLVTGDGRPSGRSARWLHKVLSPELSASLSPERFTREIRLAAALQESHRAGARGRHDERRITDIARCRLCAAIRYVRDFLPDRFRWPTHWVCCETSRRHRHACVRGTRASSWRYLIIDSSALVAVVLQEPEAEGLLRRMRVASYLAIGVSTLLETGIVLSSRLNDDARGLLDSCRKAASRWWTSPRRTLVSRSTRGCATARGATRRHCCPCVSRVIH